MNLDILLSVLLNDCLIILSEGGILVKLQDELVILFVAELANTTEKAWTGKVHCC